MSVEEVSMGDEEWEPAGGWPAWMEDLDLFRWVPRPVFARPAGLGALGSESYIVEPYKIRSPHRVFIGDNVAIAERAFLSVIESHEGGEHEPCLRIGDDVGIGADVFIHCTGSIEIGDGVRMSSRVFVGDSDRNYEDPFQSPGSMQMADPRPVRIEANVGIGVGACILAGVTIGERAMIGAGSVVTRDVPARAAVFGNPARVVRSWDAEKGEWRTGG